MFFIYKIIDSNENPIYVGMTSHKLKERLRKHRNNHKNKLGKLLRESNEFQIIAIDHTGNKQDAEIKEGFWIRFYINVLRVDLLNKNKSSEPFKDINVKFTNCMTPDRHWTEKFKQHLSNVMKGKCKGENNPFYGQHHSEETKQKITNFLLTQNPFCGKHHSNETKQKISQKNKGKLTGGKNPAALKIKCVETGEIFCCIKDTLKRYDFSYGVITRHLQGKRENAGGLHFIKIEGENDEKC